MELFDTKTDLEQRLLLDLKLAVEESIQTFGDARLLLSGGNSPKALYNKFAQLELDWSKVHIGLVDDRNVPITDDYSNEKMIKNIFKTNLVSDVNIYSLLSAENNIKKVEAVYKLFFERIDFCILGMGNDAHTASLFPGDEVSEMLLNSDRKSINYTIAPQHPSSRITCSKGLIKSSKQLILIVFGEEKKQILLKSKSQLKPISYFIKECPSMKTYYSPTS